MTNAVPERPMTKEKDYRIEHDTLGKVKVPKGVYYGAQTQRAVVNFPVSGVRLQPSFVRAQAVIKRAAARSNLEGGKLDEKIARALMQAADEVRAGDFDDQFVVDVFQAGAGTSQNMNINEVLANRANEILGGKLGEYKPVHPNDHANMGQSTNDTIHTAIHIAALCAIREHLLPAIQELADALGRKSKEFDGIVKSGRTHMQDAVPVRLGQEFGAWSAMIRSGHRRVEQSSEGLRELAIGGSAVGTGLNTDPKYRDRMVEYISEYAARRFRTAENAFEAMQSFGAVVEMSGGLRTLATSLRKIAADLILLSSGPRTGLAEINLPAVQPGSSIMPGKVNPVLAEMLSMVCFHVFGCDTTILHAANAGQLELNVMMPVIAYNVIQEIDILTGGIEAFTSRCVVGIEANEETCRLYAERSPALATALNPAIGYQKAAEVAKEALKKDVLIRELVKEKGLLSEEEIEKVLDIRKMTEDPAEKREE
jgi:fumarate hydratase class II